MYSKDDVNLQKTYQQVNEVFSRSHAKLLGSKLLGKLGSSTFETKARAISYANSFIRDLKRDAQEQKADITDPDWLNSWMLTTFGFSPKEYGIVYTPGQTQSDYIRDALAARLKSRQLHTQQRRAQATAKEEAEIQRQKAVSEISDDDYDELMGNSEENSKQFSSDDTKTEKPEKPEYQKTLENAPQEKAKLKKELEEIQRQREELKSQQAEVEATTPTLDQEYVSKLEQENLALKRELNRIAKKNLADTPESQKLQKIQQAKYSNDQWKRTPSSNKPSSFASFFDEKGNYIKPT